MDSVLNFEASRTQSWVRNWNWNSNSGMHSSIPGIEFRNAFRLSKNGIGIGMHSNFTERNWIWNWSIAIPEKKIKMLHGKNEKVISWSLFSYPFNEIAILEKLKIVVSLNILSQHGKFGIEKELKRNAFQFGWNWNWNAFQRLQTGIGIGMHSKLAWLELELESFHRKTGMYPRLVFFSIGKG